jgi:MFS family permease
LYYGWLVVITIMLMLTASSGARFLFGVVLKPMEESLLTSRSTLAAGVTVSMIMLAFLQPAVGLFADRIGPKPILVGGSLVLAGMLVALSRADSVVAVYLFYGFIGGIGFAATSPVNVTTLVNRWFRKRRGTALSLAVSGTALGQLIIVPVAAKVLTITDWRTTMLLMAGLLVVVMVPLGLFVVRDDPACVRWVDEGDLREEMETERLAEDPARESVGVSLRTAVSSPPFWILAWGFVVCGFTMAFANTHFMAFADEMGMHVTMASEVVSVTAFFSVAGTILLGMAADRVRRSYVLSLVYALRGIAFLLLLLLPVGPPTFMYALVLGVSWSATTPLTAAISADIFGRANAGLIFGTMFTFMNIGAGVGAYLDGIVYDVTGGYDLALAINVVIGLSASIAVFFAREGVWSDRFGTSERHLDGVAVPAGLARAGD